MPSLDAEPEVFLDPNTFSEDGTIAISSKAFTKDGSLCAISLSQSGSDWVTVKVCDCDIWGLPIDNPSQTRVGCVGM